MPLEPPGQSPLASTNSSGAETPCSDRPEPPRLRILHLMVLTACVAAYSAVNRSHAVPYRTESLTPDAGRWGVAAGALYSIGGGAALAGLFLLRRRRRGLAFPEHPGEYLLVMTAVSIALDAIRRVVFLRFIVTSTDWLYDLSSLAFLAINGLVFVWALARMTSWRWLLFFLAIPSAWGAAIPLAYLLTWSMLPGSGWQWRMECMLPHLLVAAALVAVVLKDHIQGNRYPWTHWFGIGTRLWLEVAAVAAFLWIAFR